MQTNGMLIDDEWCEFFRETPIKVGISLDGPQWLHDLRRKTRSGGGTFVAGYARDRETATERGSVSCDLCCDRRYAGRGR